MEPGSVSALRAAWDAVLTAARGDRPNPAHVDHATMALLQLAPSAPPADVAAVMDAAADAIRNDPLAAAAPIAMSTGALIEQGAACTDVARALLHRMPEVLAQAQAFADAVDALDASPSSGGIEGAWVGDRFAPIHWVRERYDSHPDEVIAWHELRRFCLPLIAAATRDRVSLERLVRTRLPHLSTLRHVEPHAGFLWRLHQILLDAGLRFVDLESGRVFDLRIDTVATNFELHTLLAAGLAPALGLESPPAEVVDCIRGAGPRQHLVKSESTWALYTAAAFPALLQGKKVKMDRWVWNESIPAEIPEVDGRLVVIGGPQSYARQWETGRTFAALGGTVEVVAELANVEAAAFRSTLDIS